jgi:hypothetical protein
VDGGTRGGSDQRKVRGQPHSEVDLSGCILLFLFFQPVMGDASYHTLISLYEVHRDARGHVYPFTL